MDYPRIRVETKSLGTVTLTIKGFKHIQVSGCARGAAWYKVQVRQGEKGWDSEYGDFDGRNNSRNTYRSRCSGETRVRVMRAARETVLAWLRDTDDDIGEWMLQGEEAAGREKITYLRSHMDYLKRRVQQEEESLKEAKDKLDKAVIELADLEAMYPDEVKAEATA